MGKIKTSNARGEPRPIAEATEEQRLSGVGSSARLGAAHWHGRQNDSTNPTAWRKERIRVRPIQTLICTVRGASTHPSRRNTLKRLSQ